MTSDTLYLQNSNFSSGSRISQTEGANPMERERKPIIWIHFSKNYIRIQKIGL